MSFLNITLLGVIILALLFAIFDEFVENYILWGKTRLKVPLRQKGKLDGFIFISLLFISLYTEITNNGVLSLTSVLLFLLGLTSVYFVYIRYPKVLFKDKGFIYNHIFINYSNIKQMNISGNFCYFLFIELKKENIRLSIPVHYLSDLEKISLFFIQLVERAPH